MAVLNDRRMLTESLAHVATTLVVLALAVGSVSPLCAQNPAQKKLPPPEDVELRDKSGQPLTKDVLIKATYYPGTKGKETIPLILLHGWKGSRTEFTGLATALQRDHGYALLIPDLRGHGESTSYLGGTDKTLEADRLNPAHWEAMVADVEACKKFLLEKHNAEQLNIEKLGIVAADAGAVVAMYWAVADWHWPMLAGGVKQGQDVKCLILLSPTWKVEKGSLNMGAVVNDAKSQPNLACYIIYGSERGGKYASDAKRIHSSLERFHLKDPESLLIYPIKTALQGTKLLTVDQLGMPEAIARIVDSRLGAVAIPWRDRSGPFE
jgi:pimeloyl-ACP methyl ester carboxylesterase